MLLLITIASTLEQERDHGWQRCASRAPGGSLGLLAVLTASGDLSSAREATEIPGEEGLSPQGADRAAQRQEGTERDGLLSAPAAQCEQGEGDDASRENAGEQREQSEGPSEKCAEHRAELHVPAAHAAWTERDDGEEDAAAHCDAHQRI